MTRATPDEAVRLEALRDLDIRRAAEPVYEAICRTATALFGMPIALVSLVEEHTQWFKARCGLDLDGTAREGSFCTYTITSDEVFVVEDALRDPRFAGSVLVHGASRVRFYAGAPLILGSGLRLGALCVSDHVPRRFSQRQRAQLQDLAQVVAAQLRSGQAEREARASAANFRMLAESTNDMITRCDRRGRRVYVSPASLSLLGYRPEELIGTRPLDMIHPDDAEGYARVLKQVNAGSLARAVTQQRYRHKDGSWVWVEVSFGIAPAQEGGRPEGFIAAVRDVSRRKAEEDRMAHLARHDPLTELPNRILLRETLDRASLQAGRGGPGFALHCLDLDRFKRVNDTFGHQAGDALLRGVAERLRALLGPGDTAARLGGDEFVIVQAGCAGPEAAGRLAAGIVAAMHEPIELGGFRAQVGVSIGTALAPLHGFDPARLLALADQALYEAKAAGRNNWRLASEAPPCRAVFLDADRVQLGARPAVAGARPRDGNLDAGCLEALVIATGALIWRMDASGRLAEGRGWEALTGRSFAACRAMGWRALVHPDDRVPMTRAWRQIAASQAGGTLEGRVRRPDGTCRWLRVQAVPVASADGAPGTWIGTAIDIDEHRRAEERARQGADRDALTGLPGRKPFLERLEAALAAAPRAGTDACLLLLDLDGLRETNGVHGPESGDAVLVEVAARLTAELGPADVLARLGDDEFALLLTGADLARAEARAEALLARLRQPFEHGGRRFSCGGSIGIAARSGADGAATLMTDAGAALRRAKAQGRNRASTFCPAMRTEAERRARIGAEIRAALAAGQIVPFYQPKVCCVTGRVSGFEALARWQHPQQGVLTPGYFGTAFEDPELAGAIGEALFGQIAADIRAWRGARLRTGRIALNLSSAEFRKPDLAATLLEGLAAHAIPTALFEVEVTETVFLGEGAGGVPAVLKRLHESGVLVTLDDFGTGFASLTHLKQFPVGHLKVDQSFVRNMEHDPDDAAIVAAVIGLGHALGMQVTAEGVESAGQAERLRALGCDYAQGYRYAKPMAGSRVPHFLRTWTRSRPPEMALPLRRKA